MNVFVVGNNVIVEVVAQKVVGMQGQTSQTPILDKHKAQKKIFGAIIAAIPRVS
jgi:hypothetical protein